MGVRTLSRRGVFGLNIELGKKFDIANIKTSFTDVQGANNGATIGFTSALVEMHGALNSSITNIQNGLNGLIDDAAVNGADVTWSVDQIMTFVASVDDSVVVGDLTGRDNISDPHESLIAFVMDTTGDTSLGNEEGDAASYIYDGSAWLLNAVLKGDLDTSSFLQFTDIVNDTTTGGVDKPASAETVKGLADAIAAMGSATDKEIAVETIAILNDQIVLSVEAEGDIIGGSVEVLGATGYLLVDATLGADMKTITLAVDTANEFDGVNGRVSFLKVS